MVYSNDPTRNQDSMLYQTTSSVYGSSFIFSSQVPFSSFTFSVLIFLYIYYTEVYSIPGSGHTIIIHESSGTVTRQQNSIKTIINNVTAGLLPPSPDVSSLGTSLIHRRNEPFCFVADIYSTGFFNYSRANSVIVNYIHLLDLARLYR